MSEIPMYPDEMCCPCGKTEHANPWQCVRSLLDIIESGPNWREAYLESQAQLYAATEALDEIAMNAENLVKGGLPHFSREEFAETVAFRARHAQKQVLAMPSRGTADG